MKPFHDKLGPVALDEGLDQATILGLGSKTTYQVDGIKGIQMGQNQMDLMKMDISQANVTKVGRGPNHAVSPHILSTSKKNSSNFQDGPSQLDCRERTKEP